MSRASYEYVDLILCFTLQLTIVPLRLVDPAMYFPTMKDLIELLSESGSGLRIRSIWFMEHANHGDSLLLNESIIVEHFTVRCM